MTQSITRRAVVKALYVSPIAARLNRPARQGWSLTSCKGLSRIVCAPERSLAMCDNGLVWNMLLRFEATAPTPAATQELYAQIIDLAATWQSRAASYTTLRQAKATARLTQLGSPDESQAVIVATVRYESASLVAYEQLCLVTRYVAAAQSAHQRQFIAA